MRDYVPLLVERAARERLNRVVAGGTLPLDETAPMDNPAPVELAETDPDRAVTSG